MYVKNCAVKSFFLLPLTTNVTFLLFLAHACLGRVIKSYWMWFLWENYGIKALTKFLIHYTLNPLHPNISTHILQTVLNTFPVVLERRIRLTLRASSVGDYFLYSHNFHVWLKDDIIRRNWMLITFGAKRLYQHNHIWWEAKVMASFGAWNITNPFIICVHILLNMNFHYGIEHQFAQIFVQCFSFLDVNEKGIFFYKIFIKLLFQVCTFNYFLG